MSGSSAIFFLALPNLLAQYLLIMSISNEQLAHFMAEFGAMQQQIQALQIRLHAAENAPGRSSPPRSPTSTTLAPSTRELKVASPECFDGTPSKCRAFLLHLQLIFQAQPSRFNTDAARVTFAATYLRGSAFAWFAPYLERQDASITHDYANFSRELSSVFGDSDRVASAERALMTLEQSGRPAFQYAADFRRIMSDTKWNENALAPIFYHGLRDDVKDELCKQDRPDSLTKYMEMAIKIDNRLFERRQEKKRSYRP